MYYSAYSQMFWGLILIYININIGPIDILPNFIGYIMIYSSLGKLNSQNELYNKGRIPALVMAVASLKDLIKFKNINLMNSSLQSQQIWLTILQQVTIIVNIYMIFCICSGIYYVSQEMGVHELKEQARSRWSIYFFISCAGLFVTPFMFNVPESWSPLLLIVLGANFIAAILFMALVYTARTKLSGEQV